MIDPEIFATVNGVRATRVRLVVPNRGAWSADVILEDNTAVEGRVTIRIGELALSGTVAAQSGSFGLRRSLRIVAGAGGWGHIVGPRSYHNDAGVRAREVINEVTRENGETFAEFSPTFERIGIDYIQQLGSAAQVLDDVIGSAYWWVDYEGLTHVGERTSLTPAEGSYEVLEHDPRAQVVLLAVDDLRAIQVGSVLSERLDAPQTVRELELLIGPEGTRLKAWCGGHGATRGQIADTFASIVKHLESDKLFGLWRYVVDEMVVDRVHLKAVNQSAGLPHLLHVSMRPGIAGAHAELAKGAEVLVEFVEGDRTKPVITHFSGKNGAAWLPTKLSLQGGTSPAARVGSIVNVFFPPVAQVSATLPNGQTFVGVALFNSPGIGIIQDGNPDLLF